MKRVLLVASEASADFHMANVLNALQDRLVGRDVVFSGVGGEYLKNTGSFVLEYDNSELSILGITELVKGLSRVRRVYKSLRKAIERGAYDLAILVDFAGANLPLAKFLTKNAVPVIYYIPPKVWTWGRYRIRHLKKYTSSIVSILPNEPEFYKTYGIDVEYVGNPSFDAVSQYLSQRKHKKDKEKKNLAILVGSRYSELKTLGPIVRELIEVLSKKYTKLEFYIPIAKTLEPRAVKSIIGDTNKNVHYSDNSFEVLANCDYGVIASGTAVLEATLFGLPSILIYKLSTLSYFLYKTFYKYKKFLGLPNIFEDRELVKELVQDNCTVDNIVRHLEYEFFNQENYNKKKAELEAFYKTLAKDKDSYTKTADIILRYL